MLCFLNKLGMFLITLVMGASLYHWEVNIIAVLFFMSIIIFIWPACWEPNKEPKERSSPWL